MNKAQLKVSLQQHQNKLVEKLNCTNNPIEFIRLDAQIMLLNDVIAGVDKLEDTKQPDEKKA